MTTRPRNTFMTLLILALALAALWLSGLFWFVRGMDAMEPPPSPAPADAIVVLTGGSNRLETGFDLLKKGMGKKLFISGVYRGVEARELTTLFRRETDENLECCVALGQAGNTIENAAETAAWMREQGFHTFHLVTANYHMRRALAEFAEAAPDLAPLPWPVEPRNVDTKHWWQDDTLRALVFREYTKYLLARLRHFIML